VSIDSEPFLTGEADTGKMIHVIGDVRKALRSWAKAETKRRWCRLPHQRETPATNPDGAMHLCKLVRDESPLRCAGPLPVAADRPLSLTSPPCWPATVVLSLPPTAEG
jgi:hypothetical protein